mgnify:CR=1 FL=1
MRAEMAAVPTADVAKLLKAAGDDRFQVAILLASEAGFRIGEIRGLQWGDIDHGRLQLTIRRAVDAEHGAVTSPKHGKTRQVPLSGALAAALSQLRKRGLWVVSTDDGGILGYRVALRTLHKIYVQAGVPVPVSDAGVTMPWHALRHTFGTDLAGRGVPLPTLMELMGHTDIKTTMRYVTVTNDQKRAAIALLGGSERQQVGNRPGPAAESPSNRPDSLQK